MTVGIPCPRPAQLVAAAPGQVRLRLIGHMEVLSPTGASMLPPGRKTRALLAVTALSSPRPALRGRLAELLWSRRPEEQARASLRQEVHRLLEALSPAGNEILAVNRDHVSLRPGAVWIDVEEVLRATSEQPASLSLLKGELLEGMDGVDPAFDMWLATERERVRDRARAVAETLLREPLEPQAAIAAAQRLLQIDRTHEGAWRALMRAHAARGERGMAIEAYGRCRAVLTDQLDAAPSPETEKLLTEIRGPAESRAPARPLFRLAPPRTLEARPPRMAPARAPDVPASQGAARIGVMPLRSVGTGEEESQLAQGLAEEITTGLARFRWMAVIDAHSVARFAAGTRDEAAIRQTLGIDFLLDGSVQRVQTRLRITVRLLDLRASNQVIWARRFDRQSEDLLTLQDDIAAQVVAQIDTQVLLIEAQRSAAMPLNEASKYDIVLRALPLIGRLQREPFMRAGELLLLALELDPDYAAGHAWLAWWQVLLLSQGWAEEPAAAVEEAGWHAERAVVLDPLDARCLSIAGHVRAFVQHRPREALALQERALSLNPNLALASALSAIACACAGDLTEAERHFDRYKKLSPDHPNAFLFDTALVLVRLLQHDHESAVAVGRAVCQTNPAFSGAYKPYLAALGHLGRAREAADVRRRLLAIEPGFSVEGFFASSPFERDADRDHFAQGLQLAGVPMRLLLTQEAR